MKKYKSFTLLILVISLLFSGCNKTSIKKTSSQKQSGTLSKDDSMYDEKLEYKQIFKNNIVIYKISKDVFNSFLQNNSHNYLKDNCYLKYEYPKDGEWFMEKDRGRFYVLG